MSLINPVVDTEAVRRRMADDLLNPVRDTRGVLFRGALLVALSFTLLVLFVLLYDMVTGAWPVLSNDIGNFLTSEIRRSASETGVFKGLRGTFWIGVIVMASFPIGIGAAIWLEEYAPKNRLTQLVAVNIRNLAGVPSVVYGILGLTIFVQLMDGFAGSSIDSHAGKTTAAAGATLAVLVLPIVIITASEAIRAVPQPLREGAYGVGCTRWETIRHHVLPYAAPGILTGTLLSLARALGEAAPILLVGAVEGRLGPNSGFLDPSQLGERFTAMPAMITALAGRPGEDWEQVTSAAIIVLLVVVLLGNSAAIVLRNRFERKRSGG